MTTDRFNQKEDFQCKEFKATEVGMELKNLSYLEKYKEVPEDVVAIFLKENNLHIDFMRVIEVLQQYKNSRETPLVYMKNLLCGMLNDNILTILDISQSPDGTVLAWLSAGDVISLCVLVSKKELNLIHAVVIEEDCSYDEDFNFDVSSDYYIKATSVNGYSRNFGLKFSSDLEIGCNMLWIRTEGHDIVLKFDI